MRLYSHWKPRPEPRNSKYSVEFDLTCDGTFIWTIEEGVLREITRMARVIEDGMYLKLTRRDNSYFIETGYNDES